MSRSRIAPSEGAEALLTGFVDYLREQRCVSPLTVDAYTSDARRFLERRVHGRLRELTACDVSSAVLGEVDGHAAATVRRFAGSLRAFLRYAYLAELVESDLSAAVLPVSGRRTSLLPLGLTEAQTRALLRSCDRRRAVGRRDYAMIMLMLRLGLRAREVADLELDDIDWRAGTVTVHGKRTRIDQLPLPVDVGTAIASYLQHEHLAHRGARDVHSNCVAS